MYGKYCVRLMRDLLKKKEEITYDELMERRIINYINELAPLLQEFLELDHLAPIILGELPERMYGLYNNGIITICMKNIIANKIKNKSILGFCIAEFVSHEMTHYKQDLNNQIPINNKTYGEISYLEYVSQPIELEANKNAIKFTNKYKKQLDILIKNNL